MRILITGSRGRLGSRLMQDLAAAGHHMVGVDRDSLDITDFQATQHFIQATQPQQVIHAAAWTDVDACAHQPEEALRVNAYGAQNVAAAAYAVGAAVLYVSSNEVFDGRLGRAYTEYDRPNPPNPYGYSKWVGEQAVTAVNPRHYIVRTSWLFAHGGRNFIHVILDAARAGRTLRVVTDEVAHPTYNDDLATAIVQLVEIGRFGTYHFVNAGAVSRYDFARYALDAAGLHDTPITRITRHQWPRPSTPPLYTRLNNLAGASVGITLRPWQQAVDAFLTQEGLAAVRTVQL